LGNVNNLLTAFGAIVASIAAVFSTLNKSRIEDVNRQVATLDLEQKREKAGMDFATLFLTKVLTDPSLSDDKQKQKHIQALLAVLNIVAKVDSDTAESNARARGIIPLQLALLLGQPGGLAAMDVDYRYLKDWVAMAYADDSDQTRVTAIQALVGVCQEALDQGNLEVLDRAVKDVDSLYKLIAEPDPKATAARLQLASFLRSQSSRLDEAKYAGHSDEEAKAARQRIRDAFADAAASAQDLREKLKAAIAQADPRANSNDALNKKESLGKLNAALATATQVAVTQVTAGNTTGSLVVAEGPSPVIGPPMVETVQSTADKLIATLATGDETTRQKASSDLGLLGQAAVKPMVDEIARRFTDKQSDKAAKQSHDQTLFGIATSLKLMKQPINLDSSDSYWLVTLLREAPDTRNAMADFLSSATADDAVRSAYTELEKTVEPFLYENSAKPDRLDTSEVYNAAFIVGSWASNLEPAIRSREEGKSMKEFCLERAREWRDKLKESPHRADWALVIDRLDKLTERAASTNKPAGAT
jgi:hypothetical protein